MSNASRIADLLEELIDERLGEHSPEVDADNVDGLERFVENLIDQATISADNVDGLEDKVAEAVKNEVVYHFNNPDMDHMRGLRDFIDNLLKERIGPLVAEEVRKTLQALLHALFTSLIPVAPPISTPADQVAKP